MKATISRPDEYGVRAVQWEEADTVLGHRTCVVYRAGILAAWLAAKAAEAHDEAALARSETLSRQLPWADLVPFRAGQDG